MFCIEMKIIVNTPNEFGDIYYEETWRLMDDVNGPLTFPDEASAQAWLDKRYKDFPHLLEPSFNGAPGEVCRIVPSAAPTPSGSRSN